jgi:hypothetical protein
VESTAFFVQFPHPRAEHVPAGDHMPWNIGDHGRKFLVARGEYLDDGDEVTEGELAFWAEWEPPSRVVLRWPASGWLPRALHHPYWMRPTTTGFRQNTDPWVWGERMLYSNCKQTSGRPQRRPNSMQRLTRGSVICFGSRLDGEFCVDTVFVVGSAEQWDPAELAALEVDDAFKICTGQSMLTGEPGEDSPAASCTAGATFTLYRGATVDEPVEGMFSFVPARRADGIDCRFGRPPVQLPRFINPASTQSTRGSKRPLAMGTLRSLWDQVRRQVEAEDLLLAVRLQTPERQDDSPVPQTDRQRC